jgi:hypothetical protein
MLSTSPSLTTFHLNAIVLCHLNRFFHAATQVVRTWREADRDLLGAMLNLSGNMLWARSSFEARSRAEERSMAYTGAAVSSVAERVIGSADNQKKQQALAVLASLERELHERHDALLVVLLKELQAAGLTNASPATVNAAVWSLLFPSYPYACSHDELAEAIRARLAPAA